MRLMLVLFVLLTSIPSARADDSLAPLYARIAEDTQRGLPLRIRVYVALCDNDSQGIVKVKNPKICDGDVPERNIYWGTKGGLAGFMRSASFRLLSAERLGAGPITLRSLWTKRFGKTDVIVEGLAYRGREIRTAMLDFVRAVHDDGALAVDEPHLVAYVGHNYFLDTAEVREFRDASRATGHLAKGVLALSCLGDQHIRPYIGRATAPILLLNNNLTYPGAWSIGGVIEGIARRMTPRAIRDSAARAFALGMNKPFGVMQAAFAYGPNR
jgi:hypothetical protein